MIDALTSEISASEKRFATLTYADPVCKRLMTVPGVGPSTALRFVAALDVVERFARAHKVEAYLGLSPGGEIELRTPTAPWHHQSWIQLGQVGADPGGLGF